LRIELQQASASHLTLDRTDPELETWKQSYSRCVNRGRMRFTCLCSRLHPYGTKCAVGANVLHKQKQKQPDTSILKPPWLILRCSRKVSENRLLVCLPARSLAQLPELREARNKVVFNCFCPSPSFCSVLSLHLTVQTTRRHL